MLEPHTPSSAPKRTLAENLLYTTTRIETLDGSQNIRATGTGFVYRMTDDIHVMITNKHVVSGAEAIRIRMHLADGKEPNGKSIDVTLPLPNPTLVEHPDADFDLCAIGMGSFNHAVLNNGLTPFYVGLNPDLIPTGDEWATFDAIENVEMFGCPNGLYDLTNNLPIVRRGITATSLGRKYNGRDEFLVDMACFPGSSGSPIFIRDTMGYSDRRTNAYMVGANRVKLVGILYSGPTINNLGQIVLSGTPSVEVSTMMHLGQAMRSTALLGLAEAIKDRSIALGEIPN